MKKLLFSAFCTLALFSTSCEPNELGRSSKVKTGTASDITIESVVLHGVINIDISKYNSVKCGVMISESNAEIEAREGEKFRAKEVEGKNFKLQINGLSAKTKYYYCAYVYLNDIQYEYGEVKEFETNEPNLAEVITKEVTKIELYSAIATGSVIDDCGASILERGICYATHPNPCISNIKIVSGSGLGEFTCDLTDLEKNTKYYVRAFATNNVGTSYGDEIWFITLDAIKIEAVDLGLSVKWANMNVGAERPEYSGNYFAWGETRPKNDYDWSTYKWWRNGSYDEVTKYCTDPSHGPIDFIYTLQLSDDAANANWGGNWRMPTREEWEELFYNTTRKATTINGVKGIKVTSRKSGYTNKSIFLPESGYRSGKEEIDLGYGAYYWSSSLWTSHPSEACCVELSDSYFDNYHTFRFLGFSVRPVCP